MYKIGFTQQELQTLSGLLDAGVRAVGLRAVRDAAALLEKIETAVAESQNEADPERQERSS
jgi:hypothetical protein